MRELVHADDEVVAVLGEAGDLLFINARVTVCDIFAHFELLEVLAEEREVVESASAHLVEVGDVVCFLLQVAGDVVLLLLVALNGHILLAQGDEQMAALELEPFHFVAQLVVHLALVAEVFVQILVRRVLDRVFLVHAPLHRALLRLQRFQPRLHRHLVLVQTVQLHQQRVQPKTNQSDTKIDKIDFYAKCGVRPGRPATYLFSNDTLSFSSTYSCAS